MSELERRARLEEASWNVMSLDASAVELDLMTDVPPRSYLPPAPVAEAEPALSAAAEALYGPARYVFTTKGRAAELALGVALLTPGAVVLTHPLFKTTQLSLTRPGATVEVIPRPSDTAGSADVDLAWVERRLAASPVRLIYLEPGTNALGGLPLTLENVRAVKRICQQHQTLLVLDCARLLANAVRVAPGTPAARSDAARSSSCAPRRSSGCGDSRVLVSPAQSA